MKVIKKTKLIKIKMRRSKKKRNKKNGVMKSFMARK